MKRKIKIRRTPWLVYEPWFTLFVTKIQKKHSIVQTEERPAVTVMLPKSVKRKTLRCRLEWSYYKVKNKNAT